MVFFLKTLLKDVSTFIELLIIFKNETTFI